MFLRAAANVTGAVCLDGSPAALYVAPNTETHKVYVHQEGGGWCGPGNDCLHRSTTPLGSSTTYPPTMDFNGGYLSSDPGQNPLMWVRIRDPLVINAVTLALTKSTFFSVPTELD